MSNKLHNYFQYLEEEENNDNDSGGSDSEEKSKTMSPPKISNNQSYSLVIEYNHLDKFGEEIQDRIKNKKRIVLKNFRATILKSLCDALKDNTSVDTIEIDFAFSVFGEDSRVFLRQLLAIPRIQFHIATRHSSYYHMIFDGPTSVKNISHLKVKMIESKPLDKLLFDLSKGTKIIDMLIKREFKAGQPKWINLNEIGSFSTLRHLKFPVFDSECEQLFEALKNHRTITTLDLSTSIIPAKFAQLLADLIAQNTSITSLSLKKSTIDDECFSIICKGLLKNNTIQTLDILSIEPFKRVDLSIVGGFARKKKLKVLKLKSYDIIIAKLFSVDHLIMTDNDFEALKKNDTCQPDPSISRLTLSSDDKELVPQANEEKVNDLFEALNNHKRIWSLKIDGKPLNSEEMIKQLTTNKTLKSFVQSWGTFNLPYKSFCKMIETNDSLEELIYSNSISFHDYYPLNHEDLLKSIQKNRSLTRINLGMLYGQLEIFKELLTENQYISFTNDANWPADRILLPKHQKMREEIIALNERNKRSAKKRVLNRKMNVIILARSRVHLLPIEVWREIFEFVDGRMEHFELFKQSKDIK